MTVNYTTVNYMINYNICNIMRSCLINHCRLTDFEKCMIPYNRLFILRTLLSIMKNSLQNYKNILKTYFLGTTYLNKIRNNDN